MIKIETKDHENDELCRIEITKRGSIVTLLYELSELLDDFYSRYPAATLAVIDIFMSKSNKESDKDDQN